MKVLVTGGAGFIGSHIVDMLIKNGHVVSVIDNLSTGILGNINDRARFYNCDIRDAEKLNIVFEVEEPEVVIHHAAQIDVQTSLKEPVYDSECNIIGTINILKCCKEHKVRKIIYPSSAAVYGEPQYLPIDEEHPINAMSFYGISKHTPEHYIKIFSELYGLEYTIFRYANVYGERQGAKGEGGVVSIFKEKFFSNESPVIFGDGEQTRDFVYVKDVAMANILALHKGNGEIVNISTNNTTTVNGLFNIMRAIFNSNLEVIYSDDRDGDIKDSYLDNSKALKVLQWEPKYSLNDGLIETVKYYRNVILCD